jgi:imidazolonepropionase-like amidohydrolase
MVRELELLVDAGLSPLEAIKAATANSARLCDLQDRTGTLREGLAADLILVKGKPDKNIADLRNLVLVAKDGRVLRSELPEYPVDGLNKTAGTGELGGGSFILW